ncbi:tRNA 2-thiouridine synthesizing protein A [Rubricella aquisinus]|uniref:tRNA 2-thiouridine synthesizing protein A n=1 Tax=Rubricella aquisinus TaxID=2028108 RepID=A0A840X1A3_9RHOB|nr:sulfurtransferase TusA family protein [Rubricella aquisinus]MBB5515675.1 tRNA 2-thiouridine synthesizing protein A [Rubricella aquisinus]
MIEIDAIGLICPLPVLKLEKALRRMAPGEVLRITTTDPVAVIDIPHAVADQGHALLTTEETEGTHIWTIRKGAR